jgi:hypothetical protein
MPPLLDLDAELRAEAERCHHCGWGREPASFLPTPATPYRWQPLNTNAPPPEVAARLAELGLSPYAPWCRLTAPAPLGPERVARFDAEGAYLMPCTYVFPSAGLTGWAGYSLDILGMHVEPEELPEDADTLLLRGSGYTELAVELWSQRARYIDSPLYAELLWRPGAPLRGAIQGLHGRYTPDDLARAEEGLRLLLAVTRRGPRRGTRVSYTEAEYRERICTELYAKVRAQKWNLRTITPRAIARQLGVSESTMYELNALYGFDMTDIRQERITRS